MAVESKLSDHVVTVLWGYTWRKVLLISKYQVKGANWRLSHTHAGAE